MNPVLLAAAVLFQGSRLEATATVDRARVRVGAELTLTVHVRTQSAEAPRIELPPLPGFTVQGSREATQVSLGGAEGSTRAIVRALTLRAERPGVLVIGPVRVSAAGTIVATTPIGIIVDSTSAYPGVALGPLARGMLAKAPPPARGDRVGLTVVFSADTVRAGEQLDVALIAWFPRSIRERLRRPPLLTLPTPEDVWAYPPAAPNSVVLSRQVQGQWMDLYVAHQVLFPLTAARVIVPPASVEYAVPVSFSFFSTEERYSLVSDSVGVTVLSLPLTGRPLGDQGVVARGLHLDVALSPPEARVGEPLEVHATLRGSGNVSLWPPPELRWPPGFRAYPEETAVEITASNGLIGGTKTFRYLVVPDSAGSFLLPAVRYSYFDPAAASYRVLDVASRSLIAAPGTEPRAARSVPPLLDSSGPPWPERVARWLTPWGWLGLLLLPPVGVLWGRRRRRPAPAAPVPRTELTQLGRLERQFVALLAAHVPDAATRDARSLSRALRAAGVDRAVADHVTRLRDRLRAARYGPRGAGDPLDLAGELEQVLRALQADGRGRSGRRHRRVSAGLGVLLWALSVATPRSAAQATGAEALYRAGALRAAADSFAARAARDTLDPAHWYDLGATLYRSGADGKAIAAWIEAERLAPRNPVIRRARALLPVPDATSEAMLAVGPVTPAEWLLLAGVCWIGCWSVVLLRRQRTPRTALALGALAITCLALAAVEQRRRARPVAVIVSPATPVRVAPYGLASAAVTLEPGAAVLVVDDFGRGRWLRVRRSDGVNGWVLATQVARL